MTISTNKKPKMLFVGISPQLDFSGQGKVAAGLLHYFKEFFDISVAGWGCTPETVNSLKIYSNSEEWWKVLEQESFDILFLSHDIFRFSQLPEVRKKYPNLKIIGYFTIDGCPIIKSWLPILEACDVIVTPSQWSSNVILERFTRKPVFVIPNGIHLKVWKKQIDKLLFKQEIDNATLEMDKEANKKLYIKDKFIILFVGVNQDRKNLASLLSGYSMFLNRIKETYLFVFTYTAKFELFGDSLPKGYDLDDIFLWKNIIGNLKINQAIQDETLLLKVYQASDLLVLPSCGEGFGLPIIEAMATGVIPLISNYSSMREVPKEALFLKVNAFQKVTTWNANRAIVTPEEVYFSLLNAYSIWKNNKELWKQMQERNWQEVDKYDWQNASFKFIKILTNLLNGYFYYNSELRRMG